MHSGNMADIHSLLFSALDDLERDDLKRFKMYLQQDTGEGLGRIPKGQLEDKGVTDVVEKMVESFGREEALRVTLLILKKINQNDLAQRLESEHGKQLSEQQKGQADVRSIEAEKQAEERIRELEQEIAKLKKRNLELEQLPPEDNSVSPMQSSSQFSSKVEKDQPNKPNRGTKPKELPKKDVVKLEDKLRRERMSLKELKERRVQKNQDSALGVTSNSNSVEERQPHSTPPSNEQDLPISLSVSATPMSASYKSPGYLWQSPTKSAPQLPVELTFPSSSPRTSNPVESCSATEATYQGPVNKKSPEPISVSSSDFRSTSSQNLQSQFPMSHTTHSTFINYTIQKKAEPISFSRSLPRSTVTSSRWSQLRSTPQFSVEEVTNPTLSTPQFMHEAATYGGLQQGLQRSRPGDLLNMAGMITGPSNLLRNPELTAVRHLMDVDVLTDIKALHLGVPVSTVKRPSLPDLNTFGL